MNELIICKKQRVKYLDIARGIAIILMVVGHVISGKKRNIIFSFHMPLFIIISGMFFKTDRTLKEEIINIIKKLILPYIITVIITYIFNLIFFGEKENIINIVKQIIIAYSNKKTFFNDVKTIGVLWFIPFLALSKILFYAVNKISKNNELFKLVLIFTLTIIGIYLSKIKIFLPWSFDIALSTSIFYYIGYVFNKYGVLENIIDNWKMLACICILYFVGMRFGNIELAIRNYPFGLICFITAICGTIIVFKFSKIIEKILKKTSKILEWYGKNSMYILCFHFLEINLIKYQTLKIDKKLELIIAKILLITLGTYIFTNIIKKIRKNINNYYYYEKSTRKI